MTESIRGFVVCILSFVVAASLPAAEETEREIEFTVFSPTPVEGLGFVPSSKAAPIAVGFYPTARSGLYRFRGTGPIRFYRLGPDGGLNAVAAEADVPKTWNDVLLLFSTDSTSSPANRRYRIEVLDDGPRHAPLGSLTLANRSGLDLLGAVDGNTVNLRAGASTTVEANRAVQFELRTAFRGRMFPAYIEAVDVSAGSRGLLIFFPPFRLGSLEVQSRLLLDEPPSSPRTRKPR